MLNADARRISTIIFGRGEISRGEKSASLRAALPQVRGVPSTHLTFANRAAHRAWLAAQAALPAGFRVGTARFDFMPHEAPKPARMTLTLA